MSIDQQSLFQQIRAVLHFRNLPDESLKEIVNAGRVQRYADGQIVFVQDEPCSGMYVLIQGRVKICKLGPQGQQNILATIQPVIMFNEVTVLDGGSNPVTAIAMLESTLWQIQCDAFQILLNKYPEIGTGLIRVLAGRNRRLIEHYEDLSFRSTYARVAKLLLDLSENGSQIINRREHSIEEMASLTATVPEVISRSLKMLNSQNLIISARMTIKVTDLEGLVRSAQLNLPLYE